MEAAARRGRVREVAARRAEVVREGRQAAEEDGRGQWTTPGPAYYDALLRSPFGDALTLDFARAAIAGEALGRDDAPDILVDQPFRPRLRQPRLRRRVAPLARPHAAPRPAAAGVLPPTSTRPSARTTTLRCSPRITASCPRPSTAARSAATSGSKAAAQRSRGSMRRSRRNSARANGRSASRRSASC